MMLRASLVLLALILAGCGATAGGSTTAASRRTTSSVTATGVVTMLMPAWPALDPATDSTSPTRAARDEDVDWFVYTGLTTYSHTRGRAALIPGLAQSLPLTLGGGNTYAATLRRRLVFSNGRAVTAGDFLYTVERDLRIHDSTAATQLAKLVVGAKAFERGRSRTVSGITTDNLTRTIVIRLTEPDRSFDRLLALPALGLIPAGTPMRASTVVPPAGAGPYVLTNVVPKTSFSVVKNPQWAPLAVPGIPPAELNVNVRIDHRLVRRGRFAEFTSAGIDFGALRSSRRYGFDLTSLALAAG